MIKDKEERPGKKGRLSMLDVAFLFTIFMVTLGPIKVIPGFYAMSKDMTTTEMRSLALKGILTATAISLVIALVMPVIQGGWQVSIDDLRITGGILLFASAYTSLAKDPPEQAPKKEPAHPVLSPLAIPIIITPWGAVAILMAMGLAGNDSELVTTVITVLLVIMALNLVGMLFARSIVNLVGIVSFKLLGWVFSILQAGLAVHAIVHALQNLGVIPAPT
jgi:multiple antibiotic resistance protein